MNVDDFKTYLRDADLNEMTIVSYIAHLKSNSSPINETLRNKGIVKENIFEIEDRETFERAVNAFVGDEEFMALNKESHNSYSAPIQRLQKFVDEKKIFD